MYFVIFHDLIEDGHDLLAYPTVYGSLILLVFIREERLGIAGAVYRISEHYPEELVNEYIFGVIAKREAKRCCFWIIQGI
jgi:hypothetical protein